MIRDFLEGVKKGQKNYGDNLAAIINSILLSLVYILGAGLTSIFAKISKKHFLDLNLDKPRESYWEELNLDKEKIGSYYKQF